MVGMVDEAPVKVLVTLVEPAFISKAAPATREHDAVRARHIAALEHEFVARSGELGFRPSSALKHSPVVCGSIAVSQIEALASMPMVRAVEYDVELEATRVQGGNLIMAPQLRNQGGRGNGIGVAVLDSGIDWNHPELSGQVTAGGDYTDTQTEDHGMDDNGHGTSCAGIIAGSSNGMAPQAHLWAMKVLDDEGNGDLSNVVSALDEVYEYRNDFGGAHVVNLSLGSSAPINYVCDGEMTSMTQAMSRLNDAGIPILVSAGNDGCTGGISFPACISHAIAVGAVYDANFGGLSYTDEANCNTSGCEDATTTADQVTCYSNSGEQLDILAPSHCATTPGLDGGTESCFGGTSAAAPYAAGASAQILSLRPSTSPEQLRTAFKSTGKAVTDPWNGITRRRIDALAAYQYLQNLSSPCVASSTVLCLNNGRFKVTATWEDFASATGDARVVKLTNDTGYMWFFSQNNVEVVLKVLNACGVNNRYWVFAGGLTNVQVELSVVDTSTGNIWTEFNPLGTAFAPIQDTSAFATCP
jgi:hypothetical protein